MSQNNNKELEMAVGTSNMLESNMMEGENFYTPMETATEPESATQSQWTGVKNDTGQLCRVCANSSDYAVPIYEGEGLEHQLEFKIQKHLPIQVSITDVLPLQLCYQCASTLIAYDSMISNCLEAEKKLKAMQEAAEEASKTNEDYDDSHLDTAPAADSDDEPLIQSKTKLLSEKSKATPIKKKILSKAKTRSVTLKTDKTATNSKEGEDKERYNPAEIQCTSSKIKEEGKEDEPLTYGEFQVNLIRAHIFKKRSRNTPLKKWARCTHCLMMFSTKQSLARHLKRINHNPNQKNEQQDINNLSYLSLNEIKEAIYGSKIKKKPEPVSVIYGSKPKKKPETVSVIKIEPPVMEITVPYVEVVEEVQPVEPDPESEVEMITLYQCEDCEKTFTYKRALNAHALTHRKQQHLCSVCGKQFSYRSSLVTHQITHMDPPKAHKCSRCSAAFTTARSLRRHFYTHYNYSEKEFICEQCGKRFAYAMTLKNHKLSHSEERPHCCKICGTSFKRISHLRTHEQGVHGLTDHAVPKKYTCEICQKQMVKQESLEAHMKEHTGELNYKCSVCHKRFATNTGLNIHVSMARCDHYIRNCDICKREFKADESLCEHLKPKSPIRRRPKSKDKMELASRVFRGSKYKVPRHLKDRNFSCEVCGKSYIYGCELKTHMRLAHSDEKPFVCGQCGKAFKAKASLQMHEDVHNDLRPHPCTLCDKRFRKTEHLKLHLRTHTGEKPHVCEICKRAFTQRGDMKKHMLKTHNKVLYKGQQPVPTTSQPQELQIIFKTSPE